MDPESFARGGGGYLFFLLDEGREDPNTTKSGPSSARQRNTIQMAFRWRAYHCWLGSFVILQGIRTSLICLYFLGERGYGPPAPPPPSGSAHERSPNVEILFPHAIMAALEGKKFAHSEKGSYQREPMLF